MGEKGQVIKYDFDSVIERRGTNSLKYDFAAERGKPEDALPFWVADMDFRTAPAALDRLHGVVRHGVFGYSDGKEDYFRAVAGWYKFRCGITGRIFFSWNWVRLFFRMPMVRIP